MWQEIQKFPIRFAMILTYIVIIVMIIGLSIEGADSKKKPRKHRGETITIIDNSDHRWESVIRETIDDFNTHMPKRGPEIRYKRGNVITCQYITICSGDIDHEYWGMASINNIQNGRVLLQDASDEPPVTRNDMENVVCHELMHSIGGVEDQYGSDPVGSCIWGYIVDLGPTDIAILQRKYGK